MTIRRRMILILLAVVAVILIVAGVLRAFVLNPDAYRSRVVSYLEAKTGKQVDVGRIAIRWRSASIELDDFGIRNPEPFPKGYFFKARRVEARTSIMALLHRQIVIKSIALQDPVINVISDPDGLWNFENPDPRGASAPSFTSAVGTIGTVTLSGGELLGSSLIDPSDRPGPVVLQIHGLSASLQNVNFDAFTAPQQSSTVATGHLSARSLQFGSVEVTGLKARVRLSAKKVVFESVGVDAEGGRATGQIEFDLAGKNAQFAVNAHVVQLDVARLLSTFPGARGEMTGTMHGEIALEGPIEHTFDPLAGLHGRGKLTVVNGQLPELNGDDSLKKMMRFRNANDAGKPAAAFSSFSSDLELTGKRMTNRDIDVAFFGFDFDCAGYLDLDRTETLDYHGTARVLKKQGFVTNVFAELFHEARNVNGKLVFPLLITGTLANPKFSAVD